MKRAFIFPIDDASDVELKLPRNITADEGRRIAIWLSAVLEGAVAYSQSLEKPEAGGVEPDEQID